MAGTYNDPNNAHNPATGTAAPAAWGDLVRDDLQALYGKPRVRVYKSLVQGIGAGLVDVTFDQVSTNTHTMWASGNPTRLTVPTGWGGDWLIGATVLWANSASGTFRNLELWINNALIIGADIVPVSSSGFVGQSLVMPFGGVAGDYYTLRVSQDTGGSLNVTPNGYAGTVFWATFLGNGNGS